MSEKARTGSLAEKAKRYCDLLFALETEFAELTPGERFDRRQKESKPLMEAFVRWLRSLNASSKSAFGNAAGYVFGQRQYLDNYLLDSRLEISNNRAERGIKPFVIGRKNFLFTNTTHSAQASAVMFHEGLPMANEPGHGFGTKSMVHIVEKHGGICQFSMKDGWFMFQATA